MKKVSVLFLAIAMLAAFACPFTAGAANEKAQAQAMSASVASWLSKNAPVVKDSTDIDGNIDWSAFACFRAGFGGYEGYLSFAEKAVAANYDMLYTSDLARIALAVGAVGGDPTTVGGHNLIEAIAKTDFQSESYTAAVSCSLLALNSKDYGYAEVKEELKGILISAQREDGGFNYLLKIDPADEYSKQGDVDSTAMVLQALAPYAAEIPDTVKPAAGFIQSSQKESGGFGGAWGESADSTAQSLAAFSELGIDPLANEYVKNGKNVLDALKSYQNTDGGMKGFDGKSNVMSSYQVLYALSAYLRFADGKAGLYEFMDTDIPQETTQPEETAATDENPQKTPTPATGSETTVAVVLFALACIGSALSLRKRHEEV